MKQYDEWKKSFHYVYPGGQIKPERAMMEEAFRAGMLAAADIVMHSGRTTRVALAEEVREAAE